MRRRLRFFETHYAVWLWLAAASVSLASWAVGTLVDNVGGQFRINRPVTFVATLLGSNLVVYAALRIAHQPFLAESRAVLHDLERQVLDETRTLAEVEAPAKSAIKGKLRRGVTQGPGKRTPCRQTTDQHLVEPIARDSQSRR